MKEVVTRIKLFRDGDQFCALVGDNIQEGVAGFGPTLKEALSDLGTNLETEGRELKLYKPQPLGMGEYKVNRTGSAVSVEYRCPGCGQTFEQWAFHVKSGTAPIPQHGDGECRAEGTYRLQGWSGR